MIVLMGSDKLQADESEAFFRILLDSAPDAMIIVDEEGAILLVNAQAEAMFGFTRDELLGKPVEMLLPEAFRDTHIRHREQFIASPSLRPMGAGLELIGRRKDGTEFPVEISLSPVKTKAHSFVSSVIRDVSRRKMMEQEIIGVPGRGQPRPAPARAGAEPVERRLAANGKGRAGAGDGR